MIKTQISLFLATFLVIGLLFITFSDNAEAGSNGGMEPLPIACSVLIEKLEIPDTGRDFDFELTGDVDDNFSLTSGETTVLEYQENGNGVLTENIPEGYTLNIECTEGSENCTDNGGFVPCLSIEVLEDGNGVTIECDDSATNDMGSCTFTNTLIPRNVPTLSLWGLIAMAGILAIVGLMLIRRRRASA